MKWTINDISAGQWIKTFLLNEGRLSKRLLIKAKSKAGFILVNGEKKTVRYMLQEGDVLEVILPPEKPAAGMTAEKMKLDVLYEDAHLLVINKPAGTAVIPSRHHPSGTIANGLLHYYGAAGIHAAVHIVTRLDRDTSGAVVVAKSQYCHSLLSNMQRKNELEREYTAVLDGKVGTLNGTIDLPIGRKSSSIVERRVTEEGQQAITHYEVVKHNEKETVVQVKLETGRTHQIRVHFAHMGHPVKGDDLYGAQVEQISRQALHCSKVAFKHPFSTAYLEIIAPLPEDMRQLLT